MTHIRKAGAYTNTYAFEMVKDSIEVEAGGIRPGAKFSERDMVKMLADKVLANYTLVRHIPTDTIYHVNYGGK